MLDLIKGLRTTARYLFQRPVTISYPEVKRPVRKRFRGKHELKRYADGKERCIGCSLCAAACPADAIYVEPAPVDPQNPQGYGERYAAKYEINMLRCIYCGYCEDACPTNAIVLEHEYELSFYWRALTQMIGEPALAAVGAEGGRPRSKKAAQRQAIDSHPWLYRSTDDVNAEIVRSVGMYKDASYAQLKQISGVWGRQPVSDPVFYDGTSYKNTEGFGIQWPTLAEQPNVVFDLVFSRPEPIQARQGDLLMIVAPRLYDGGTLMQNAEGIGYWVAQPYVGISRADADRLTVATGDVLRLTSAAGAVELPAKVDGTVDPGTLLVPDLESIALGQVQTGVLTPVRVEQVEG